MAIAERKYRAPYQRIEADLRRKIHGNVWAPGMILPSRRQLAEGYRVSLGTIERAVADLLADGTLTAQDRRGTFVADNGRVARSLVEDQSPAMRTPQAIGIVCTKTQRATESEWAISWDFAIVSAIERTIASCGMRSHYIEMRASLSSPREVERVVDELIIDGVDGIVFVALRDSDIDAITRHLASCQSGIPPTICVLKTERQSLGTSIYYDSRDAGYRAALHLLDQGCRSIQFFSPYVADFAIQRLDGIRDALSLAGLSPDCLIESVRPSAIGSEYNAENVEKGLKWFDHKIAGKSWAQEVLTGGLKADGVVAVNDEVATSFIEAADEIGLSAGEDYAIIGFDDMPIARLHGISSMRPPLDLMGEEAVRLILQAASGKQIGQRVCLHSQLVARRSSRFDGKTAKVQEIAI